MTASPCSWAARRPTPLINTGAPLVITTRPDGTVHEAGYARKCADWLGWKFEHPPGDPALLRDLLWGNWDAERFQIIEPGWQLGHAPDESILRADALPPQSPSA
ncbi:MAG: hypothetical protein NTV46_02095 [Verrucomicrobia bacterium]|nr:hypothetical protein [Verrucomicrobiota bacterium]